MGDGKKYGLNNLINLSGFKNLYRIGGDLIIRAEGKGNGATSGTGQRTAAYCLSNLQSIDIPSLKEIGGSIVVDNFDSGDGDGESYYLINISDFSFSSLETIGGDITYHYIKNSGYSYCKEEGYGTIKKAPRFVKSLHDVNAIYLFDKDEDGFISLETIDNLKGNGVGFPNLKTILGSCTIRGAEILNIGELSCLETIGNNLSIYETNISQINGFNKLSKVGSISLSRNSNLSNISGFSALENCSGITIVGSPSMYDFSRFVNAVNNGSSWSTGGCGYNPTKYQMINGQSKPE